MGRWGYCRGYLHSAFNIAHLIPRGCISGRKATCVKVNLGRGYDSGFHSRDFLQAGTKTALRRDRKRGYDGNSCARDGIKGLPNKNGARREKRETRDLSRKRRDNAILSAVISPRRTVIGRTFAHNAPVLPLHPFFFLVNSKMYLENLAKCK